MAPLQTLSTWRAGLIPVLLIFVILSSCSSRVLLPTEDPSRWAGRSKLFLRHIDGSEYVVTEPVLQDSMITGTFSPGDRREIHLDEIASLSVSEFDTARTIGLTVWGLAAAAVLIILLGDGDGQEPCPT